MSVEPIRPEDHSIIGNSVENAVRVNQSWTSWHAALEEAIHQTFERDARSTETTGFDDSDEVLYYQVKKKIKPDPDTEIDRLARLIVQGEYRRRSQAND